MTDLKQINNGRQQCSYKEFTITLQAGDVYTLNNPFNYFRCLESDAEFQVAWSTNQMDTTFYRGLGVRFDDVIPYAQLYNPTAAAITLKVAVGIGFFDDSRINFDNDALPVQQQGFKTFSATSGTSATTLPYAAGDQIDVVCTSGTITLDNAAGITALILNEGQTFSVCLATAGTLNVTGTGSWNISLGSW